MKLNLKFQKYHEKTYWLMDVRTYIIYRVALLLKTIFIYICLKTLNHNKNKSSNKIMDIEYVDILTEENFSSN